MESATREIVAATRVWIERAVIGLNLCPFAKPVYEQDRIRYVVSTARTPEALFDSLERELRFLAETSAEQTETTLIIHPWVLGDFLDYNDFIGVAERGIQALRLEGVLQVASFHPDYRFGRTSPDDVTNCTNRSPYPMLHLLREASIEAAVASYPDTDRIYRNNIATLRRLGQAGWDALGLRGAKK